MATNKPTQQLPFDLPIRSAHGRDDFFVSPANAIALAMLDGDWQGQNRMVLSGPEGAGKTHLAHVWAGENAARVLKATDLAGALENLLNTPDAALVVEDIDDILGDAAREEPLFHLLNARTTTPARLLLSTQGPIGVQSCALPDLKSRLMGLPVAPLDTPDDAVLTAVLVKLFADRQLDVSADVITYLSTHMERSFAAAGQVVHQLDRASLAAKRPITRPLAAQVLQSLHPE